MSRRPADLAHQLARQLGSQRYTEVCVALLGGAAREDHEEELALLAGASWPAARDTSSWHDYWVRTWGARGLLHVWDGTADGAVVAGLHDEHWRPAEMCLKVTARHVVVGAGPAAADLAGHPVPRVRAQALRALAVVGDTEHVEVVRRAADDVEELVRTQAERALSALGARLDLPR